MIVEVPAATPKITPVETLTVAFPTVPEVHVPPEAVEVKVVVPVSQIVCVPLKVPAVGGAVTVIVLVAVALVQPPVPTTV